VRFQRRLAGWTFDRDLTSPLQSRTFSVSHLLVQLLGAAGLDADLCAVLGVEIDAQVRNLT
jgi:hypothetical protein